jgi:ferrochelatase
LCNSQKLADKIKEQAGTNSAVAIGMRYGSPSIAEALDNLKHCDSIYVVPLYPQYSSAATGSSIEETLHILASWEVIPSLHVIRDFYCYPPYIKAQAQTIKKYLGNQDHLLFSYHGIPENQLVKTGCKSSCTGSCPEVSNDNSACYRAQCMQTSRLLAKELHLQPNQYDSSFQSRLGKTPWIKPYTDAMLINLASRGIKNLTISCPSFVADCLETLEEIGMRAKHQWLALGGERFTLVPSMNDDAAWVEAILKLVPNSNEIAKL